MEHWKEGFVTTVAAEHGEQLVRFFAVRMRSAADAQDLAQEVYLRLLRLKRPDLIRNPEAYLYTIALHIVRENALRNLNRPYHVALDDISSDGEATHVDLPYALSVEDVAQEASRVDELEQLLADLTPKARAVLIWHRRDGQTYKEIAARLGISVNMVKKYLVSSVAFCRKAMAEAETSKPVGAPK